MRYFPIVSDSSFYKIQAGDPTREQEGRKYLWRTAFEDEFLATVFNFARRQFNANAVLTQIGRPILCPVLIKTCSPAQQMQSSS